MLYGVRLIFKPFRKYEMNKQNGVVGIVSAVNGLVIPIPTEASNLISKRLAIKENADVVSIKRTKQLLSGAISPEEMTEVYDGAREMKNLAGDLATQINIDAVPNAQDIADIDELQEAKKPKAPKRRKVAKDEHDEQDEGRDIIRDLA